MPAPLSECVRGSAGGSVSPRYPAIHLLDRPASARTRRDLLWWGRVGGCGARAGTVGIAPTKRSACTRRRPSLAAAMPHLCRRSRVGISSGWPYCVSSVGSVGNSPRRRAATRRWHDGGRDHAVPGACSPRMGVQRRHNARAVRGQDRPKEEGGLVKTSPRTTAHRQHLTSHHRDRDWVGCNRRGVAAHGLPATRASRGVRGRVRLLVCCRRVAVAQPRAGRPLP